MTIDESVKNRPIYLSKSLAIFTCTTPSMMGSSVLIFSAVGTLLSFVYLSQTLERHSLTGHPRLSSVLILLLAGAFCFAASFVSKWLPGQHGRFDGYQRAARTPGDDLLQDVFARGATPAQMPHRPRRLSLPLLVVCIVVRLEIFHRVNQQQQCAETGIEAYLCVLLWLYEVVSNRRKWSAPESDDLDDPWRSVFDDLRDWLSGPRPTMVFAGVAAAVLSTGTYLSVGQSTKSTYLCFSLIDSRSWVASLQVMGLFLDAVIIILLWRMLAWSRTTRLKLRALASVLAVSSLSMAGVWLVNMILHGSRPSHLSIGSLYAFDLIFDSIVFAVLAVSAALWICESTTLVPATVITVLVGVASTISNMHHLGTWEALSRLQVLTPLGLITAGTTWFSYTHPIKSFVFLKRIQVAAILALLLGILTLVSIFRPHTSFKRHPVNDLVYKAHIEHDRWLRRVSTSSTLPVAVEIYKKTHDGRDPPPYFDEWYSRAKDTVVIDEFRQIYRDLAPFRKVPAKSLRQRAELLTQLPGIASITIEKGGQVKRGDAGSDDKNKELDSIVEIVQKYAEFLPPMTIPFNLNPTPRILPSWEEAQSDARADLSSVVDFLHSRSFGASDEANATEAADREPSARSAQPAWAFTSAQDFQSMHLAACPPNSKSRKDPHWRVGEFCSKCTRRHSKGPIMTIWDRSLEVCQQPDIHQLHSFFMTNPAAPPLRELLPLFGPSKMDGFDDIIFPLPSSITADPDIDWEISQRYDTLFWRGDVGEHAISASALRGSQKFRLMRLVTRPDPADNVVLIYPYGRGKSEKFYYEQVPATVASAAIPFSVGFNGFDKCLAGTCDLVKQAYGSAEETSSQHARQYRYVLLTDEDDGPPRDLMRILKSGSVPFVSTTFRTWYSERLMPWLHFVPIDIRFQGLHATYTYFTGSEGRNRINGRRTKLKNQLGDAEWIAQQGRKWADKAIGRVDLEMYTFRLLLEWARLIDDDRDRIGFARDDKGILSNTGWTSSNDEKQS